MNTQNEILILGILLGSIFTIVGLIQLYFPPKNINPLYGYRTKRSMTNINYWRIAQNYSAKHMIISGIIYTTLAIIISYFIKNQYITLTLYICFLFIICILIFIIVEKKLKQL